MPEPIPSKFQVWKLAARPHTLTASVVPVIVGYALTLQLIHRHSDLLLRETSSRSCAAAGAGGTGAGGTGGGSAFCSDHSSPGDVAASSSATLLPLAIEFALFAALIQISTNLHNDYADFVKGADTDERVGQARATQKGWLTPYETCRGCVLCLLGALLVGMHYLIPFHHPCVVEGSTGYGIGNVLGPAYDPIMIFIVLSSLFNAVAYTGGPFPLGYVGLGNVSIGYSGLGDLFVFLYFGIVATMGAPYLYVTKAACWRQEQIRQLLYPSFLHSIPIGFLATAIIVVNNLRDRHTDVRAGKKTMAVRFGGAFAKMEYLTLVVGSYAFCIYFWSMEECRDAGASAKAWTSLLPLFSFPLAIPQLKAVAFGGKDGQALNDHIGGTAMLQMVYCILMTVGLIISLETS